jgi:hypothetical protein
LRCVTLELNGAAPEGDWAYAGAASHVAAVTDGSDGSYIESATDGSVARFGLSPYRLREGEFVSGIRVQVRAATRSHTLLEVSVEVADRDGTAPCGGLVDRIAESQPIHDFVSFLFPGTGSPFATDPAVRGVMTHSMLDGMTVQVVLRRSSPDTSTSRVYAVAVELHVSDALPRIRRRADKLALAVGGEARVVGVNFRTDDFHDKGTAQLKAELTRHREKGFNLARVHVYTSRIKSGPGQSAFVDSELAKLVEILQHCNDIGMYVDLTLFAAYRRGDNPAWYEALSEAERWADRQYQARQICGMFDQHPAVAWYCLGNEFVVPSDPQPFWVQDPIGPADDLSYLEMVVKQPAGRTKGTIWSDWLANVLSDTAGARAATTEPQPLFGCGSFPPIADETLCTPRRSLLSGLGLVLLHAYPERDTSANFGLPSLLGHIMAARQAGLPCVLEEFFPAPNKKGSFREMEELLSAAHSDLSGIAGHSDGLTSTDYRAVGTSGRDLIFQSAMRWYEQHLDQVGR